METSDSYVVLNKKDYNRFIKDYVDMKFILDDVKQNKTNIDKDIQLIYQRKSMPNSFEGGAGYFETLKEKSINLAKNIAETTKPVVSSVGKQLSESAKSIADSDAVKGVTKVVKDTVSEEADKLKVSAIAITKDATNNVVSGTAGIVTGTLTGKTPTLSDFSNIAKNVQKDTSKQLDSHLKESIKNIDKLKTKTSNNLSESVSLSITSSHKPISDSKPKIGGSDKKDLIHKIDNQILKSESEEKKARLIKNKELLNDALNIF